MNLGDYGLDTPVIIDTPEVLSDEYDLNAALEFLAEKAHQIVFLFDAGKLDVSNELKDWIKILSG
jgi:hypothetical protein